MLKDDAMPTGDTLPARPRGALAPGLTWRRFGFAAAVALVVSTEVLFQPELTELWSATDIALAVGRYALELLFIAAVQVVVFTRVDAALITQPAAPRTLAMVLGQASASFLSLLAISAFESPSTMDRFHVGLAFAESLRWTLLSCFITGVYLLHRHAEAAHRQAARLEEAREALQREQLAMQLQLLQAQIEPHFLFNTLANMRRLYQKRPQAGAGMLESLLRYLRAALPRIRNDASTLGDELALVGAYLDLVRLRMGPRLRYRVDADTNADTALHALAFPSMLVLTLVENAVKHGLEPDTRGGSVEIAARRLGGLLEVTVQDDGVGLHGAGAGGQGVGLANIRRQLALRFGADGRLDIAQRHPRGVVCTLRLPLQPASAARRVEVDAERIEVVGDPAGAGA